MPILTGTMAEEGVLIAYFLKDQLDQLQTHEILYKNILETGAKNYILV